MRKLIIGSRGEISTIVVAGLLVLLGVVALVTTTLNKNVQDPRSEASETCNFDSGQSVSLGSTESNASNTENRWPISTYPYEYDVLGPGYYVLKPNTDQDVLNLTKQDGGAVDSKMNGFMGSMFGYKPAKLSAAYDVSYGGSAPQGNDTAIKGDAPVLEIPTEAGTTTVKVPSTGYDIGGGYEAMVVFASSDRVAIHIGRHEYFVGSGQNNCNGGTCSGGYWIYVKGICVDKQIQQAYDSVKSAQQAAGADKNPIQLPMVRPGQILGKATGTSVIVGVRDNGPFITTSKPVYWEGVPSKDIQPTTAQPTTPAATATTTSCYPGQTKCPGTNQCVDFQDQCTTPTPTLSSCYPGQTKCIGTNICVDFQDECPTPTTAPSSAPTTAVPTTAAVCTNVTGATFKFNAQNNISFFRVNMAGGSNAEYGPQVSFADNDGNKSAHIEGPSFGAQQWEPGVFSEISISSGQSLHFYTEVISNNTQKTVCNSMVVTCTRTNNDNANTEIACTQFKNVNTAQSQGTFRTTTEADTAGELVETTDGKVAIVVEQI